MEITTKFNNGDYVFGVSDVSAHKIVTCNACVKGKLKIGDEEFVCPKCHGRSAHPQYAGNKHYVSNEGIVGQVRVEVTDSRYSYSSSDQATNIEYMIDTTGVRSGQIWKEEKLFPTRELAQSYCDRMNLGLKLEDEAKQLPALM